ncbi:Hematopoietic prostaglandin d synthase [Globisporangium polare]
MSAVPPQIKLTYFEFPGRGETARLLFTFGGIAFEDQRIVKANFAEFKGRCPLGKSLFELFVDYESIRYYEMQAIVAQIQSDARVAAYLAAIEP